MSFKEGEVVEEAKCPKCGSLMHYEMGFDDRFSYTSGHYTVDVPMKVCDKCDYCEEEEPSEPEYDEVEE